MGSGASDRMAEATPTSGNAYIPIFREHSGRQAVGDPPHPPAKYGFTEKPAASPGPARIEHCDRIASKPRRKRVDAASRFDKVLTNDASRCVGPAWSDTTG